MNTAKQQLRFQEGSLAINRLAWPMLRYQQFVGSFLAQHLDSHQHRRNDDSMKTVHADRFDGMEIFDWPAGRLGKCYVATEISSCATRLEPTDHVALCQVLVHQAYCRLCVNSSFFQHPQCLPRQSQSHLV